MADEELWSLRPVSSKANATRQPPRDVIRVPVRLCAQRQTRENNADATTVLVMPGVLPSKIERLIEVALVGELTVISVDGGPITYPLIPLYDGRYVYLTSAVLFSKKLRHIKANPKVCLSLTDPVAIPADPFARATIQGDAEVLEDDLHEGWEELLPLWRAKEPVIDSFVKKRFGIPLFFERSIIRIDPIRTMYWPDGRTDSPPEVARVERVGA